MAQDELLFTFAIITDTHIRPPGSDQSSPFPVNDLANGRARYAAAAIARHQPAFTIHLGDMVHPLPHLPTYGAAAEEALRIFAPLGENLHFVPGNHDIGDKPMAGSPAGPVSAETESLYGQFFGSSYYSFTHDDTRIIVINSSLAGSGSPLEAAQKRWLETELANEPGKRTLLFSHYPPFIDHPGEPLHYDNYEAASRAWLLDLVRRHEIEAVFSGHVHQFFFNRINATQLYCLPPTSFIRQDYSELYRVDPAPEFGRNDAGKFSYALVDVYRDGHKLRIIPTDGEGLDEGEALSAPDPVPARPGGVPLTVHMRQAWARSTDLPYNGPMEEFGRKRARDDYCLLRLWQMGISRVRVPLADLLDPDYGQRVHEFAASGIRFSFFTAGVPSAEQWQACLDNASFIDSVEFVSGTSDLSDIADDLAAFEGPGALPVHLGKFHSSAHEPASGSKFAHSVSPGFKWDDRENVAAALKRCDPKGTVKGAAFQINLDDDLAGSLAALDAWGAATGLHIAAIIKLAARNPAIANFDDEIIAARLEQALGALGSLQNVSLQVDTYADIDRGYHPRNGLIDRRSNLRLAGRRIAAFV
ncbi:MAG: hypothetical protein GY948_16830 [Alphaproteobacteria bacterium]|nr:hypothetical protein [Alphaproteobacteria bacterium]